MLPIGDTIAPTNEYDLNLCLVVGFKLVSACMHACMHAPNPTSPEALQSIKTPNDTRFRVKVLGFRG